MPTDLFHADWYLRRYPDVAAAVQAGLTDARSHFEAFGIHEGRSPGPLFDTSFYLSRNPDVAAAAAAGLFTAHEHFLLFGASEGRAPIQWFDVDFYLRHNPDVAAAVRPGSWSAVEHFIEYGWREDRAIGPLLDAEAYLAANPDVAQAVRRGEVTALEHFLIYGEMEGRSPQPDPEPDPPEPVPPTPDPPGPEPDDPGTIHLYPGDVRNAQPGDERYVVHVNLAIERQVITVNGYAVDALLDPRVIDVSRIGLKLFDSDNTLMLDVLRGQYEADGGWNWDDDDSTSLGVKFQGKPHLQLTESYGKNVYFDVGPNGDSFAYELLVVNIAEEGSVGEIDNLLGVAGQMLIGGAGMQHFVLTDGVMAFGREGLDIFTVLEPEERELPAFIGDYSLGDVDLITFLSASEDGVPVWSPFDLQVKLSDFQLDRQQGVVEQTGEAQDLEVWYAGGTLEEPVQVLHVANVQKGLGTGSVVFLLEDAAFAVYNVFEGGLIDTTDLPDFGGCGCGRTEYLMGGEGAQEIEGGDAAFALVWGGGGADTLTSKAMGAAYFGGSGDDTINIEPSEDSWSWIFFEGAAGRNGVDTINKFRAGELGDMLDFSEFLIGGSFEEFFDYIREEPLDEDRDFFEFELPSALEEPKLGIVVGSFAELEQDHGALAGYERAVVVNLKVDSSESSATIWFYESATPSVEQVATLWFTGELSSENFTLPTLVDFLNP